MPFPSFPGFSLPPGGGLLQMGPQPYSPLGTYGMWGQNVQGGGFDPRMLQLIASIIDARNKFGSGLLGTEGAGGPLGPIGGGGMGRPTMVMGRGTSNLVNQAPNVEVLPGVKRSMMGDARAASEGMRLVDDARALMAQRKGMKPFDSKVIADRFNKMSVDQRELFNRIMFPQDYND